MFNLIKRLSLILGVIFGIGITLDIEAHSIFHEQNNDKRGTCLTFGLSEIKINNAPTINSFHLSNVLDGNDSFMPNPCVATFTNEGNQVGLLWEYFGNNQWSNNSVTIQPGATYNQNVENGEVWQIWNQADDQLFAEFTIDCNENTDLAFTQNGPVTPPEEICPQPVINVISGDFCSDDYEFVFTAEDLGFPCLEYEWDFGTGATPSTATGLGPITVVFSSSSDYNVSLTASNNCENVAPPANPPIVFGCCNQDERGEHDHPHKLILEYVGGGTTNITFKDKGQNFTFFSGQVSTGDIFVVDGTGHTDNHGELNRLDTDTEFKVGNNSYKKVHTSCSQDISPGFGIQSDGDLIQNGTSSNSVFIVRGLVMLDTGSGSNIYCEEGITEGGGGGTICGDPCIDCEETTTINLSSELPVELTPEGCPIPEITCVPDALCTTEAYVFTARDLGYPCLEYTWNFGNNATPSTATGLGPISVVFSTSGSYTVSLTTSNNCENPPIPPNPPEVFGCCNQNERGEHDHPHKLILEYVGGGSSNVTFTDGDNFTFFSGQVSNGDLFVVDGTGHTDKHDELNRLETDTYFSLGSGSSQDFHTSCSQDISPGFGITTNGNLVQNGTSSNSVFIVRGVVMLETGSGSDIYCEEGITDLNNGGGGAGTVCGTPCIECEETTTVIIEVLESPDVVVTSQNAGCLGNDGSITFTFQDNPNRTNIEFSLDGGVTYPLKVSDNSGSASFENLTAGTYDLYVRWGNNECAIDLGIIILEEICDPASVGDFVFQDDDGNGFQDPNEPGIPNVTVKLQAPDGTTLETTSTNGSGFYQFTDLNPGDYKIMFNTPDDFTPSPQTGNASDGNNNDSDNDPATQMTEVFSLDSGEDNPTIDAGFIPICLADAGTITRIGPMEVILNNGTATLSATPNGDQVVPPGYQTLYVLTSGEDLVIKNTSTTPSFTINEPDKYTIHILIYDPNTLDLSIVVPGQTTGFDVNSLLIQGSGDICGSLLVGGAMFMVEEPQLGSIGDFVFQDDDGDGIQDPNELGVPDVTVQLKNCANTILETTTTNGQGFYNFGNLDAGCYRVQIGLPNGFSPSPQQQGGNEALDSDINPTTLMTENITLDPGEDDPTIDAGLVPNDPCDISIAITNIICNDNGTPDNPNDDTYTFDVNVTGTGTSAQWEGNYSNPNLGSFGITPRLYNTPVNLGPFPIGENIQLFVNDVNQSNCTDIEQISSPEPCSNAGDPAKIGDFVWDDLDADGIQDPNEPGLPFIFVILEDCNGGFLDFKVTDPDGQYCFEVEPGSYKIKFANPGGGYQVSPRNAGNDDNLDSDMNIVGRTDCITVSEGEQRLDIDGGFTKNDPPPSCTLAATVTDIECNDNKTNDPSDDTFTFNLNVTGTNVGTAWLTVINGQAVTGLYNLPTLLGPYPINGGSLNFEIMDNQDANCNMAIGVIPPDPCSQPNIGSIGDRVWFDTNSNGIQDIGELGVGDVTIRLFNCDGSFVEEQTTTNNGTYLFTNLPANTEYYVEFSNIPLGLQFSAANQGTDDIDSDVDSNGRTPCVLLNPAEENRTLDAGIQETPQNGKIGNFVWNDLNENGIQEVNEPGISQVTVILFKCDGEFVDQTVTSHDGSYCFFNVKPNMTYYLQFSNLPADFQFTIPDVSGNDNNDSDANTLTGQTTCFDIAPGQTDNSRDAGIYKPINQGPTKLGNFVWNDLNGNGIQDPNEPGIAGVFVVLETCDGIFQRFAITDSEGIYCFEDITPGSYRVKFANPGFPMTSPKDAGGNDNIDNDMNFLGYTDCITIVENEIILSIDGGFTDNDNPPPICTIEADYSIECNDNGTPNDNSDDTFTISLIVSGGIGSGWIVNGNTYDIYDASVTLNDVFYLSDGEFDLSVTDADNPDCYTHLHLKPFCPGGCDNVTNGGKIQGDETNCDGYDPTQITEVTAPTGGSGALEYLWLQSNSGCPTSLTQAISGATQANYDPPYISETTWFIRCVRRTGCTDWTIGESNCVVKTVDDCGGGGGTGPASVGDRVWNDTNGNGIQDTGEDGLAGVWINLQDENGNSIVWTVAQGNGYYSFEDLDPGIYRIKFANPGGFIPSPKGAGTDQTKDSDIDFLSGTTDNFVLSPGENNIDIDAGFKPNSNVVSPLTDLLIINEPNESKTQNNIRLSDMKQTNYGINQKSQLAQPLIKYSISNLEFSLFPNPANNAVILDLDGFFGSTIEIKLYNSFGMTVKSIQLNKVEQSEYMIDLSDFREGFYLVSLKPDNQKPITRSLIIAKH